LSPNLPSDDVFLTTEEVLEYLQVNLRTVYRLIKAGEMPAVRVGRLWRFRKRDIDAWLDRQRSGRPAQGTIPAEPVTPLAASRPPEPGARPQHRVLVVDDESSIREMLSKTLALAAYEVDTAADAAAALDLLRASRTPYDLLIADLKMPGIDGLTLIRQVRELQSTLRIIIITGYSTKSSAIEAVNLGVSGYLTKPFRVPEVLAAAARAMGA
jgi:excisionase family DNA binding protein